MLSLVVHIRLSKTAEGIKCDVALRTIQRIHESVEKHGGFASRHSHFNYVAIQVLAAAQCAQKLKHRSWIDQQRIPGSGQTGSEGDAFGDTGQIHGRFYSDYREMNSARSSRGDFTASVTVYSDHTFGRRERFSDFHHPSSTPCPTF